MEALRGRAVSYERGTPAYSIAKTDVFATVVSVVAASVLGAFDETQLRLQGYLARKKTHPPGTLQ